MFEFQSSAQLAVIRAVVSSAPRGAARGISIFCIASILIWHVQCAASYFLPEITETYFNSGIFLHPKFQKLTPACFCHCFWTLQRQNAASSYACRCSLQEPRKNMLHQRNIGSSVCELASQSEAGASAQVRGKGCALVLHSDDGMTGIGQRGRPSPAGAKLPPSKLKGKEFPKVKKLQKFSVPAVPLPPPGCALVPAALLHQLQSEVGKTALPVLRQEQAPEVQNTAARKEPEALPHLDPHQSHPHPSHPAPVAARAAPKPLRLKDGGARPIVIVKHAGVSTEDAVDGPPPPPGARHASVGTVDAVEEGTQTTLTTEGSVQPAAAATSAPPPPAAPSGPGPNAGEKSKAESWQPPQPVITPVGMAAFSGFAQPGSPDKMNSTDHGRFDLFGMDKFTAEKDRDRKRLQAQMLAEQIQAEPSSLDGQRDFMVWLRGLAYQYEGLPDLLGWLPRPKSLRKSVFDIFLTSWRICFLCSFAKEVSF
eukprot:s1903_g21.t1